MTGDNDRIGVRKAIAEGPKCSTPACCEVPNPETQRVNFRSEREPRRRRRWHFGTSDLLACPPRCCWQGRGQYLCMRWPSRYYIHELPLRRQQRILEKVRMPVAQCREISMLLRRSLEILIWMYRERRRARLPPAYAADDARAAAGSKVYLSGIHFRRFW